MIVRVLGAGAGGGFPQWNCGCPNCVAVRAGDARFEPRTQDAIALSADGTSWTLVNASPDVLRQIERTPDLHPRAPRHSPIAAIVLTNGDLDHVLGLFSLRESQPLVVYATDAVRRGLEANAMMRTLARFEGQLTWRRLALGVAIDLPGGLTMTPHAAPGKLPVHLVGHAAPTPEDNIGLVVRHGARAVALFAASSGPGDVIAHARGADALFFDGTFFTSDELVRLGLSKSRAEDMAHWPVESSLRALAAVDAEQRIYTHINNTNPMLAKGSPERAAVESAGWTVACDGMTVTL